MSDPPMSSWNQAQIQWKPVDSGHIPTFDYTMETTNMVLNTLQDIGSMTAIPLLGEAASITARIVTIIQDVKDRNQAFKDLASDAYGLVCTVSVECHRIFKQGQRLPRNLEQQLSSLISNLRDIERFSRDKLKRGMMKKIIFHTKDLEQINRYRTLLKQSIDVFGLQSHISIQENLQVILSEVRLQASNLEKEKQNQELERLKAEGALLTAKIENLRLLKEKTIAENVKRDAEKAAALRDERVKAASRKPKIAITTSTPVQTKREDTLKVEPRHRRSKSTQGIREKSFENEIQSTTPDISSRQPPVQSSPYLSPYPYTAYPPQYPPPQYGQYPQFSGGLSPYPYSQPQASISLNDIVGSALSMAGSLGNMSWGSGNVINTVVHNVSNDYCRH